MGIFQYIIIKTAQDIS